MPWRLLILFAAVGAALCAAAPAHADGEPPISSAAQLYTCCTPEALQERLFAEAEAGGAEYVRVDVELHGIFDAAGSRDRPDWSRLDRMVELARRHDVKLLGIIRGTPTWLSDCPNREPPKVTICAPRDPVEWGRLAGEVAAHARGSIDHWEILNEPDARWAFTGSAEDYARMLRASYDAIAAGAPEAQVVFGGVERPREHEWIERALATRGADAAHAFDIAAVHLRLRLRNELNELPEWLTAWRGLLAGHGFDGPIWVTEHGYPADPAFQWDPAYRGADPAGGDAAQANLLRDSIPLLAKAGAGQIFVTLRDNLFGEFLSEGLVHVDEAQPSYPATRRPSFAAVRDLALKWDRDAYARSGGGRHERLARELELLAGASQAAGRPVAAALQQGAADGHDLLALELVRAAARGRTP
jgi:hypothetical protein